MKIHKLIIHHDEFFSFAKERQERGTLSPPPLISYRDINFAVFGVGFVED
jgi:hypothetical protein